jgi:NADH:ubiquinone oxidoreductase subunit 4 (subunit M)
MANIAVPGTSSFVGELLILAGIMKISSVAAVLGATGMVLGGGYSLWLFNRISYGNLKIQYFNHFSDMDKREFCVFLPLILGTLGVGIYPVMFLNAIHVSTYNLLEIINPLLVY